MLSRLTRCWVAVHVVSSSRVRLGGKRHRQAARSKAGLASDLELVEKLIVARTRVSEIAGSSCVLHYLKAGDIEKAKWAEEELRQYHRIPKQAFRLDLDVPPPTLPGNVNVPEANKLLHAGAWATRTRAGAPITSTTSAARSSCLQKLLTEYPQSDKISDAAYSWATSTRARRTSNIAAAAMYFERCFQWNPKTQMDARIRAARLYDKQPRRARPGAWSFTAK